MGGNTSGGSFLGENFLGWNFPVEILMGGNFLRDNFPEGANFPRTSLRLHLIQRTQNPKNDLAYGWNTYRFSYALHPNGAKNMTPLPPPAPCYLHHFHIFDKINSFPKNVLHVFRGKKENCTFEELFNLYLIVLLISFLLFFCGLQQKIELSWRNYLFELQSQVEHKTTNIQTAPD